MRVFEYGAGMPSVWYAERVSEVVTVEHDPVWAKLVSEQTPANCQVVLAPEQDAYVCAITDFDPFDVVVVDGLHRPDAALAAVDGLTPRGVMVWDNSDLPESTSRSGPSSRTAFGELALRGWDP